MGVREDAIKLHKKYHGKLEVASKISLKDRYNLSLAYTPGVAEPCLQIKENKDLSFEYTCRGNMVAVISDGTRVLGLGDIGPEAALPVMEGKAVLFKMFADVDAVPLCLDTKDEDRFVEAVQMLQPNFAGINLEDLSSPKCYDIEDRLKKIMDIPVFHDDQHGTAISALAAVIGALRLAKKKLDCVRIVVNGAGAAGTAIARLLISAGACDVTVMDLRGALHQGMPDLDRVQQALCNVTNPRNLRGGLLEIAADADILIGVSAPAAFTAEIIQAMNEEPVVLAMANPTPEISYEDAKAAGAFVAGTGRSDAPNQVNNLMVFPGLFRGAIDVRARQINEEMKIAAAYAIADLIEPQELREDYVVPDPLDPRIAPAVAAAVAAAAVRSGVARMEKSAHEVRSQTEKRLKLIAK